MGTSVAGGLESDYTATAAQVPMATGATVAGRPELRVLPFLILPGSLGLWTQLPLLRVQDPRHYFPS